MEDSPDDAELLLLTLRREGLEVVSQRVDTAESLARALSADRWDAVLSDYSMPSFSGLDALRMVRERGRDLPFILVSGTVGEDHAVGAMKAGAHDYLMKGRLARLVPALERALDDADVRRAQALHAAVMEVLAWAPSLEGAAPELLGAIGESVGFARAELWVVDYPRNALRCAGRWRARDVAVPAAALPASEVRFRPREGLVGLVWSSGQAAVTTDPAMLVPIAGEGSEVRSAAGVPILHDRGVIGVLVGLSAEPEPPFTPLLERLRSVCSLIGQYAARRGAEDRFRSLLESAPDATVIANERGEIAMLNAEAEKMFGYAREELLGRPVETLVPPEVADRHVGHRAGFVSGRGPRSMAGGVRLRGRRKDGTEFPAEVNLAPIQTDDGLLISAAVRDVSERVRSEEALRASEERARVLVDSLQEGILLVDREGLVRTMNPAARRILGVGDGDLLGQPLSRLGVAVREDGSPIPADASPDAVTPFTSESDGEVVGLRRPDGSFCWILVCATPLAGTPSPRSAGLRPDGPGGGASGAAVVAFTDITERKALEEQLRHSQKMEALGRLAGGVAHDFNNLLTAILGYSELLARRLQAPSPLAADVEEIRKAGMRASVLTRQLLTFSRRQVVEPKTLELNLILTELEKMLRPLIGETVDLALELEPVLHRVRADRGQLEQVVVNLVVNARDAMPEGGRIVLRTSNRDLDADYAESHLGVKPGPHVLLSVSDTGTGIDPEHVGRIFEPFFTTKGGKGTGLGLSTVYGIVKQSGGHVDVYTERGHGTTFKVYLPRATDSGGYPVSAPPPPASRGEELILLVEDDESVRRLTKRILEASGFRVLEASSGKEAHAHLESHGPSVRLLLTDTVMPDVSGPRLARELREKRPSLAVLFMSGYSDTQAVAQGLLEPGVAFLEKPFTAARLTQGVRRLLDS